MDPITSSSTTTPGGATPSPGEVDSDCPPSELPEDLSAALLALINRSRGAQTDAARGQIEHAEALLERARAEIQAAMERANDARESAGFWADVSNVLGGDVATIAGIVAAAVVVVGTGGTGAPAILALVACGLSAGSSVGQRLGLDPKVCLALSAAGALLGVAGGNFASLAGTAGTVATGARLVQAGATAASGVTRIAEGERRADALDAEADRVAAQQNERDAWLRIDIAAQAIAEAAEDWRRARERASDIQRTDARANEVVLARIGGA
jgi:hypothetical protein